MSFENVFISAKKIGDGVIAVEVDVEKAKSFNPFIKVGIVADGHFTRRGINMFGGVFEQNDMSNVDTFPAIVWQIENYPHADYPNHLIIYQNGEFGNSILFNIIDTMQQYNWPPEQYYLEIKDCVK